MPCVGACSSSHSVKEGEAEPASHASNGRIGAMRPDVCGVKGLELQGLEAMAAGRAGDEGGSTRTSLMGVRCPEAHIRGLMGSAEADVMRLEDDGLVKLVLGCWK